MSALRQVIVIPARYESSRLPGKPLVMILGKTLVQRVWERCVEAVGGDKVYVATDDHRIEQHCQSLGANVVMTPSTCLTGTDRLYQANLKLKADSVINVQGDEPLVSVEDIKSMATRHLANIDVILNGMGPLAGEDEYHSTTVPKVVATPSGQLLYMSRGPIPANKSKTFAGGHKQICIYGFSAEHLRAFGEQGAKTPLEEIEDIEILRFLEMGYTVQMVHLKSPAIAVDIPEDIPRVEAALRRLS